MYNINQDRPFTSVVIDTTLNCNLMCQYCHEELNMSLHKNNAIVELKILKQLFIQVKDLYDDRYIANLVFCWYGGEPLLIGLKKFEEILKLQRNILGSNVFNQINTNATLIDKEWISFFENYNIEVILSIDGPEELNKNRISKLNTPSFEKAINGFRLINQSNIPVKYINVVTIENVSYPELLYDFCKGLNSQSVDFVASYNPSKKSLPPKDYLAFMTKIFTIWYQDLDTNKPKRITTISSIIDSIQTGHTNCCTFNNNCGRRIYITTIGDIKYCCNGWYNDSQMLLGNIMYDRIKDIIVDDKIKNRIYDIINSYILICEKCDVFEICKGGCRAQITNDFSKPTYYCDARIGLIKFIKDRLN